MMDLRREQEDEQRNNNKNNNINMNNNQKIVRQWEAEIATSVKEKADVKRVEQWLKNDSQSQKKKKQQQQQQQQDNGWRVALASGTVCGLGCEWVTDSPVLSLATFCGVCFVALRDPFEEEEDETSNLAGPVARIIGRSAIKSYETTEPKLKAVARAALFVVPEKEKEENETKEREKEEQYARAMQQLQMQVETLRQENRQLKSYVERREWIDEEQSQYNLEELKVLAQRYRIPYSGVTKPQLMMRLLQVGALRIPSPLSSSSPPPPSS